MSRFSLGPAQKTKAKAKAKPPVRLPLGVGVFVMALALGAGLAWLLRSGESRAPVATAPARNGPGGAAGATGSAAAGARSHRHRGPDGDERRVLRALPGARDPDEARPRHRLLRGERGRRGERASAEAGGARRWLRGFAGAGEHGRADRAPRGVRGHRERRYADREGDRSLCGEEPDAVLRCVHRRRAAAQGSAGSVRLQLPRELPGRDGEDDPLPAGGEAHRSALDRRLCAARRLRRRRLRRGDEGDPEGRPRRRGSPPRRLRAQHRRRGRGVQGAAQVPQRHGHHPGSEGAGADPPAPSGEGRSSW